MLVAPRMRPAKRRPGTMNDRVPLTDWLRDTSDADAGERAYQLVYAELRRLAACQLGARNDATLTPTALVNEAFLKLAGGKLVALNDRRHFFNLAARAMRQTVIDHARERLAEKRGGDLVRTQLDDAIPNGALDVQQALAIDQALDALAAQDEDLAEVFGLRVFTGLDVDHIAELRGVSARTVQRNIELARNYLRLALGASS
jgi:RNA polymerase sigma factor (TIGR02999 family)